MTLPRPTLKHYITEPIPCPKCGAKLVGHFSVLGKGGPTPGSLGICAVCGILMQFNPALGLVQLKEIPSDVSPRERAIIARMREGFAPKGN